MIFALFWRKHWHQWFSAIDIIFTYKIVHKSKNFWKIQKIIDEHKFGTKYARAMKLVSKCAILGTLSYFTNNSFWPKVKGGFRPFWKLAPPLHVSRNVLKDVLGSE